ncbi:MAG: CinA family protein [Phycisphaerales bacterium]|nr:CinA family protein [Phycisphaerales bacterium]
MSVFDDEILEAASRAIANAKAQGVTLGCVESCTGGLVGGALTAISGSSEVFAGGLVTYSDEMKNRLVGVQREVLDEHGAVSSQVAAHMAMGGVSVLGVNRCVSITGIAGPGGGSDEKPVGTVWFGLAVGGAHEVKCSLANFEGEGLGGRDEVRMQAVLTALSLLDPGAGDE